MAIWNPRTKKWVELDEDEAQDVVWNPRSGQWQKAKKKDEDEDEDIAPVKESKKKDSKLDFFQKGAFSDGYQFGDALKTIGGTIADASVGIVKGAGRLVEGGTDLITYGMAGVADLFGADLFADEARELAKKDTVGALSKGTDNFLDDYSVLGRTSDSVAEGVGQIGTIILTGGAAGAMGLGSAGATALTTGVMGLSSMGSGLSEAYNAGASGKEALAYGFSKGAIDAGTELLFGGLGKTVKAVGLSKGISSLDDVFAQKLSSKIANRTAKNLVQFGVKASAEGFEEVLAGIGTAAAKKLTYMDDASLSDLIKDENLLEQFVVGAVSSGIAQSGIVPGMKKGSLIETTKADRDFISGFSTNEQKVLDSVAEKRIAETEKNGKKLTKKEKNKIYDDVTEELQNGKISVEDIEEALGGDSYKAYRDTIDKEDAAIEEIKSLYNNKTIENEFNSRLAQAEANGAKLTNKQKSKLYSDVVAEKRAEFEEAVKGIRTNPERKAAKAQLSEYVQSQLVRNKGKGDKVKLQADSYLMESYNDAANRRQDFQADLNEYKNEHAKQTVKNIMDAKVMNNGRRAHEIVNFLAKVSSDKGVTLSVTDAKRLAQMGKKIDGRKINGYKDGDNIVINLESDRSLNFIVGHEISHVLEGTEFYKSLQDAIFEYAKKRKSSDGKFENEYAERLYNARQLYKDVKGYEGVQGHEKIKQEVVADLVGDYLFTDPDFVKHLFTEHRNVFQKIYDEIKYLLKVVTAGSKEEKELLKVKKAFEDAYRADSKPEAKGEKAYSLSIKYTDGTVEELADARNLTNENVIAYLKQAKSGKLRRDTYIPVRKDTPQVIIDTLEQVNENVSNSSLVMQVRKAQQAMSTENRGGRTGNNVRSHGLSPEEIVDIINKLDDPSTAIYQTNRKDKDGNDLPNNVAFFVEYNKNGAEGLAVIEFDSSIDSEFVGTEFGDTSYHTVVTVFEPDTQRYGMPFDYAEELLSNPNNTALEIIRRQSTGSATGEKHPNTSSELPSDVIVPQKEGNVNTQFSLSSDSEGTKLTKEQSEYFKDTKALDSNGNLLKVYHTTNNDFTVFDKSKKGEATGDTNTYLGFFFADDAEYMQNFPEFENGKTEAYYLNVKNPIDMTNISKDAFLDVVEVLGGDVTEAAEIYDQELSDEMDRAQLRGDNNTSLSLIRLLDEMTGDADYHTFIEELKPHYNELMSKGYDGVVNYLDELMGAKEYIVLDSNQAKLTSNTKPTADADIRFSLSEVVEETKDLMALHNLKSNELLKSLELGGLPMPSLAVIKAQQGHEKYGDVSLIFTKDTIDPKTNQDNKIYGGDAWTPTYPRIEYKVREKSQQKIRDKYYEIANKHGYDLARPMYRYVSELESALNIEQGEANLLDWLYRDTKMMQVYLADSGKGAVEDIVKEIRTEISESDKQKNQWFIDKLGEDVIRKFRTPEGESIPNHRRAFIAEHKSEIENAWESLLRDAHQITEEQVQNVMRDTTDGMYARFIREAEQYLNDGGVTIKTETDYAATERAIEEKAADGYKEWVDGLFKGVQEKTGIRNDKDTFTSRGDRRSWDALHWSNTLENVVRAMKTQDQTGADAFSPASAIFAVAHKRYNSIEEVKADSHRLGRVQEDEYKAMEAEYASRLAQIAKSIQNPNERNPFIANDEAAQLIVDAVRSYKSKAGMLRYMKEWNGRVTETTVDDILSLVNDIANMPTGYFEAKPQRAVGFDEVGVFVIPRNADVKLKQELLNRGYTIAEYDPDVEGDRQKVVNSFEQYKFSLSDASETPKSYGRFNIYGKDVMLEEDIAPVGETADNVVDETVAENITPIENSYTLRQEQEALEAQIIDASDKGDADTVIALMEKHDALESRIKQLRAEEAASQRERIASLTDADAPPEMDAPYYSEDAAPTDPFEDRDIKDVGDRKVKAYMYENPEVKPFFQEEAARMLRDLQNSQKGERIYTPGDVAGAYGAESYGTWSGVTRLTTEDIAYLLDNFRYTYDQIAEGLNDIIEDHGAENNAVSKRIEFMLNDRLMYGYQDMVGFEIPPNQDYINLLNEKQITEYNEEARKSFFEVADDYAPIGEGVAENATTTEDIAPMPDTAEEEAPKINKQTTTQKQRSTRAELHQSKVDGIKAKFAEKGLDLDEVLKKAKDLSTFSTVDNTPQRVMEKSLGYKEGQILADETVNKVAQNETEGIKWLNSFTDRKSGLLAKISKQYNIKPGSKESAAAQMYAEGFYVDDKGDLIKYGDTELAKDFPDAKVRENIKGLAGDSRIRQIYDDTLKAINESRARNAYPEIPRLDNYFLHFRAMDDTFSRLGLPFNPNDIRAKDLPTDLNGVTADLKPGQPYFASAMHRRGQRTSFDLLGGLERYLSSAKNQIYHIDDIQTFRALRNYIADTYGQANGLEGLDALTEEEAQERIKDVYNSHLSTFAKFLNEEANVLAGKTALIDRGIEGMVGRRAMTFMDTLNKQVGSNMVGYNVSSALTNLIAPVQAFAKTNKFAFVKGFAQTVANRVKSISGKGDGFTEESPVVIRRKGADRFYRTAWQKMGDPGYALMGAVDNFSTELIARAKYNELTAKGMDSATAHLEADKWVSRIMGDRSLGQMPQLYNSKALGLITKFQLEVRNQLDSQFYDTIKEADASTEDIQNGLKRNAKKAAKITSTFFTLAVGQHLFGKVFESIAGYNPAFDIISVIMAALGLDDDEESEDTVLDNIEQGFMELMGDLPYTSILDGGRIPIASALPIEELYKGVDQYGNEKSRLETIKEALPYYLMPGGYGQVKKTMQGLSMFDEDHPIAGSYTDSGNLRFPVEDTLGNRIQAGIFGQWASDNARDYFDNEYAPLKEKQIQEFVDLDISIGEYRKIREDLAKLDTLGEKAVYIANLNLPIEDKNLLINNIADREEPIDLTGLVEYGDFGEFEYAKKYPDKYKFLEANNVSYEEYQSFDEDTKEAWSWAYQNPEKFALSKAVSSDLVVYKQYTKALNNIKADKDEDGDSISGSRKKKVIEYINELDADYGEKIILFKSVYNADDTYNYEIVDYLNNREDLSYEDVETILKELGFKVDSKGNISW